MACLIPSLESWALGAYPPCPASQQVLHVCNYLGDSLPQAVMHIVGVILVRWHLDKCSLFHLPHSILMCVRKMYPTRETCDFVTVSP